jgi:hypothetical protein
LASATAVRADFLLRFVDVDMTAEVTRNVPRGMYSAAVMSSWTRERWMV